MPRSKKRDEDIKSPVVTQLISEELLKNLEAEAINVFERLEKLPEPDGSELKDRLLKYLDGPLPQTQKFAVQLVVGNRPKLRVSQIGSKKFYTVDILKSLDNDPINIVHPLIVCALEIIALSFEYYPRDSSPNLSAQTAKKFLSQIYKTWIAALERHGRAKRKKVLAGRREDDKEYFQHLQKLIRNPEIFQIANEAKRKRLIKEKLEEYEKQGLAPGWVNGHTPTLDFLITLDPKKLPKDWRALHTSYLEWESILTNEKQLAKKTIKQYLWEGSYKDLADLQADTRFHFARVILVLKAGGMIRPVILSNRDITISNLILYQGTHKEVFGNKYLRVISDE